MRPVIPGTGDAPAPVAPESILALTPAGADQLLSHLEEAVPRSPSFLTIGDGSAREAIIFGDSHGDWRTTVAVVRRFLADPKHTVLVGLGDYVDRPPPDCPNGSVANLLYLLTLRASFPGRVHLLLGNHETVRRVPCLPHRLPAEVRALWGPAPSFYDRMIALAERGGLAARTESGAYFAHAAFPVRGSSAETLRALQDADDPTLEALVWGSPDRSAIDRGVVEPFTEEQLVRFLEQVSARVFLRGHDPDVVGQRLYGDRCLTLHSSRLYQDYGGVLMARVPLDRPIGSLADVAVEHVETEHQRFPIRG